MAFDKNIPMDISEYKVYNVDTTEELEKVASEDNIDFPEGFVVEPDYLYIWVRIVSAGERYGSNNNADYFPEEELIEYWETFKNAHAFKDHKNKSVADAIGRIITVRWNDYMKCVEILKGIDTKRAAETARGYAKGYLDSVSMGCRVPYTVCSVCGNKARVRSEFCDHVRKYRNRYLGNGERVYEINYKPKFHDSSTVLTGAERVAKAFYIMNPETYVKSAFRKAASDGPVDHYIRVSEGEMQKVASYQQSIHPLLKDELEKVASDSEMMKKIAELEKELTGRLVNIMSEQDGGAIPEKNQMLEIIKFLTEKRMDESSLINIAHSVKEIANENNVPISRAFSALMGIAELMGIEFFPSELHTVLSHLTDAKLNKDLSLSKDDNSELFPSEFARGMNQVVIHMDGVKSFKDPGALVDMYDEAAHRSTDFGNDPLSFLDSIGDSSELSHGLPSHMVRVIKKVLNPLMPARSYMPEHLYPRLSVVLTKRKPVIGSGEVRRDFDMLANPQSLGELLGALAYNSYERCRPSLIGTRMVKMALDSDDFMEKKATVDATPHIGYVSKKKPGIGVIPLAMGAVPAAYAASAYQKSKRENGRFLSDGENFTADNPGIIAGGAVLAGVPLSRKLAQAAPKAKQLLKAPFIKEANEHQFTGLVKIADSIHSGSFNAFEGNEVVKRYMSKSAATGEQASAVKYATLFTVGGMDKTAYELMNFYNIPHEEIGSFLKVAAEYVDEEMDKAAEDFTNNMLLSVIGDTSPLSRSLPGRAVDAFVFKKLGEIGKEPVKPKNPPEVVEGGVK